MLFTQVNINLSINFITSVPLSLHGLANVIWPLNFHRFFFVKFWDNELIKKFSPQTNFDTSLFSLLASQEAKETFGGMWV